MADPKLKVQVTEERRLHEVKGDLHKIELTVDVSGLPPDLEEQRRRESARQLLIDQGYLKPDEEVVLRLGPAGGEPIIRKKRGPG